MERTACAPTPSSAVSSRPPRDLDAEFPAVAARAVGFERVARCWCPGDPRSPDRCEGDRDGCSNTSAEDRYTRPEHVLPCAETRALRARTCHCGTIGPWRSSLTAEDPIGSLFILAAGGYRQAGGAGVSWRANESPFPARCAAAAARDAIGVRRYQSILNRYPDPPNTVLKTACPSATTLPITRIAIGNGSCERPAGRRRGAVSSPARSSSTHGRPSRYIPHLAAASPVRGALTVPLDSPTAAHDLPAMLREVTVATRLVISLSDPTPTDQH